MGQSYNLELIQDLIKRAENLAMFDVREKDALIQETALLIQKIFTDSVKRYEISLGNVHFLPFVGSGEISIRTNAWEAGKGQLITLLNTMKKELEWFEIEPIEGSVASIKTVSNKIFLVHGHDDGMKNDVARVIEKLGLVPIILHERNDNGLTVIEKLEANALDCTFAVVLLSPDDKAFKANNEPQAAKFRARQNVILELGYFVGKLGRGKVLPLVKNAPTGELEIPSDYAGVVYTPYDVSGGWKMKLIQYLRANGYTVDANNII